VVFCEIAPNHLSLAEEALAALFREKQIDVIIAPSHFGIPAPIENYKKYGVPVIEDACQAFFTRTTVKSTADIMVLSFYPTKQFNCIEGGAILHNSLEQNQLIEDLRYYDNQIGFDGQARYNLRMANLHAAFGCLLLEQIAEVRKSLLKIRDFYINGIYRKNLLIAAQCEAEVVPYRFMLRSTDRNFFDNLISFGIQSEIELIELNNSSIFLEQSRFFENLRSIPYYNRISKENLDEILYHINTYEDIRHYSK
jgi:dTDP-4-amino-4,6-dideoxygalactose transaminase